MLAVASVMVEDDTFYGSCNSDDIGAGRTQLLISRGSLWVSY